MYVGRCIYNINIIFQIIFPVKSASLWANTQTNLRIIYFPNNWTHKNNTIKNNKVAHSNKQALGNVWRISENILRSYDVHSNFQLNKREIYLFSLHDKYMMITSEYTSFWYAVHRQKQNLTINTLFSNMRTFICYYSSSSE